MLSYNLYVSKVFMKLYREIPEERLISTQSLLKINVAYNTRYRVFLCTLCHGHVPLKQLHHHLISKTQDVLYDAPGYVPPTGPHNLWRRQVVHRVPLPVSQRGLAMFICVEMRKHGIIIQGEDRARGILLHDSQDSPVLGVPIYTNGFTCLGCQYSHQNSGTVRKNCSCEEPEPHTLISTPVQTIGRSNFTKYFPLPGHQLPSPPVTQNQATVQPEGVIADTVALIQQHKKHLVSRIQQSEGFSQDVQSIPPCFINLSIHDFWEGCNWKAAQSYSLANLRNYPIYQRVRALVQTTLQADFALCDKKKTGSGSACLVISHHIMESSHGSVHKTTRGRIGANLLQTREASTTWGGQCVFIYCSGSWSGDGSHNFCQ